MLLLSYASVPLYDLFCKATGYGGTTSQAGVIPTKIYARKVKVRFNTDVNPYLPWSFTPDQKEITLHIGETTLVSFTAQNLSQESVTGTAIYNVTPFEVGQYFAKIECFCYSQQTLAPNQTMHFPVSFYLDPSLLDDRELDKLETITLSYTFFPAKNADNSAQ